MIQPQEISKNPQSLRDHPQITLVLIACVTFLLLFTIIYFDAIASLVARWVGSGDGENEFTFGFLVLLCTLYLLYDKIDRFKQTPIKPFLWALIPSLFLSVAWFVVTVAGIETLQLVLLPLLILSATTTFLGLGYLRLAALPVLILVFSTPLLWPLIPYLKDVTTAVSAWVLRFLDRPVFTEGYFLHLPGGSFLVDDSCAGLRFLTVTLTLSFVSIDLYSLRWKLGLLLLACATFLSLLANCVRVIIVVWIGDATQMQTSLVDDHYNLGWAVYCVAVLLPFFLLLRLLSRVSAGGNEAAEGASAPGLRGSSRGFLISLAAASGLLFVGPGLAMMTDGVGNEPREIGLPAENRLALQPVAAGTANWRPAFRNETRYLQQSYHSDGGIVTLHIVNYKDQSQGTEITDYDNTLTDGVRWSVVPDSENTVTITSLANETVTLNSTQLRAFGVERKLVWHWFEVGQYRTNDRYWAKLFQFLALIRGRSDANLIAVSAECAADCELAESRLREFVQSNLSAISGSL